MKISAGLLVIMFLFAGTGSAARLDFYSQLDLPIYTVESRSAGIPQQIGPSYIGSDKSYAAEPKEVRIIGRSLSLGFVVIGLVHPAGLVSAAGFLIVGLINGKALAGDLTRKPKPASQWDFLWSRNN